MKNQTSEPKVINAETTSATEISKEIQSKLEAIYLNIRLEHDGLRRFNEIEENLKKLTSGTPEFKAARKERTEMIKQVRGARERNRILNKQLGE